VPWGVWADLFEYEFYSEDHLETQRYWRRWGTQFTMHANIPLLAIPGECRERAR
jgi:hypothetical protein